MGNGTSGFLTYRRHYRHNIYFEPLHQLNPNTVVICGYISHWLLGMSDELYYHCNRIVFNVVFNGLEQA